MFQVPKARQIETTHIRCHKCGSRDLFLIEVIEGTTMWEVTAGKLDLADGMHEPGPVDHMEARCRKCNHIWRMRKAYQVTDCLVAESA